MAVMKNSKGEIVAEQKVIVTAEGSLITSNTSIVKSSGWRT
jgi:hypothetical protein